MVTCRARAASAFGVASRRARWIDFDHSPRVAVYRCSEVAIIDWS